METTRPASGGGRADVRLLGLVEVIGPGGPALLPGSRQRALVGLLALRPGVVLARSSLVDALWGEEPPRTAVKTLYSHVTRVRQAMEACGLPHVLSTREPGYALLVPPGDVDAHRFAEHLRQAAASPEPAETAAHLRTALDLWQGDAFADTPLAGWGAAEVDRLHEARLTATEDLWEAELELGQHRRAAAELEPLVARHPYRERLVGLLMLARYRSGRHAEALDAYHRLRTRLDDELGVDPGPELQRRYAAILRHDPELDGGHATVTPASSLIPRPAQLPAPVGHFTGRTQELRSLDRILDEIRIVALSGPAGMGKTALALHWAHRIKDRFEDGQLFLDLRGHEPGDTAMAATEALPHLLRSLGVPPDRVPAAPSEQAGMYRSLLHDKQLLIMLDNCGGVDQLLPLVPGTDRSLLVVTSRGQLTALAARHAVHLVGLDSLEQAEAVDLLGRVLGRERVDREPASAVELVELCGRMPLALRIAAALLAARPRQPIGELTASLATENRLDALSIEGDSRSLRAVFASAYHAVSPPAARLFRLLGLHPGRTIAGHLAAAVASVPVAEAHDRLAELAAAHLINDLGDGRYRFHDLIGLYAAECAQLDEPPAARTEATDRIVDWYLALAETASRVLDRQRDRVVPQLRYPPDELPVLTDHDSVLAFLDGERANLVPLVRYATEQGRTTAAWHLTYLLAGFFRLRGHWADRIEICRWAVKAARREGPQAESLMQSSLGVAYNAAHRFTDALEPLQTSLSLAHSIGDKRGQGNAHHNLAGSYAGLRRYEEAIDSFQQALALFTATNQTVPMALMLNNIGEIYARTGQTELGFEHLRRGLDLAHEVGDPWLEAAIRHSIGQAHLRDGNIEDAESYLRQALDTRRRVGDHRFAAETLTYLGVAQLARGDAAAAIDVLSEAITTCREVADEHLEATALNHLGEAYLRAGDTQAAAEPLQLALALRARLPDPDEEVRIKHHLGELRRLRADPASTYRPYTAEPAGPDPEVSGQPERGGGLPPAATPRPIATNRSRRPG